MSMESSLVIEAPRPPTRLYAVSARKRQAHKHCAQRKCLDQSSNERRKPGFCDAGMSWHVLRAAAACRSLRQGNARNKRSNAKKTWSKTMPFRGHCEIIKAY